MAGAVVLQVDLCVECAELIEPALFGEPDDRVAMEAIARKLEQCPNGCASYAALVRSNGVASSWVQPSSSRRGRRRGR